jgi:DMSO/TMAO reductase YedYZ molybdopterin-dependent catalytic subunit
MSDEMNDPTATEKDSEVDAAAEKRGSDNTADILRENRHLGEPLTDDEAAKKMRALSRRGFTFGGAAALIGVFGWRWMPGETKEKLLGKALEFNERISQVFYRPARLAPEFPRDRVSPNRSNGGIGISGEFDPAAWRLKVGGLAGRTADLELTLDDIRALPRTEMTTELKCIEGWSVIVRWAGVKFSDFAAKYGPKTVSGAPADITANPQDLLPYVSLVTPDNGYYVGWDIQSIMHPQTLLAYEMNGEPLLPQHGAPLRLASPTKYGIKQLKRIGRIEFTSERPADYWAEKGYDWYSGH